MVPTAAPLGRGARRGWRRLGRNVGTAAVRWVAAWTDAWSMVGCGVMRLTLLAVGAKESVGLYPAAPRRLPRQQT